MSELIKLSIDKDYLRFFEDIKKNLHRAQMKAALAANTEQIRFYWETGIAIINQQKQKRWGSKFLEQLAHDLKKDFPGMQGFSKRNLEFMRKFAMEYPGLVIAKQPISQLPWGHIITLIQKIQYQDVREWYAQKTIENGWSRSQLIPKTFFIIWFYF